jgi:hypothetical protein
VGDRDKIIDKLKKMMAHAKSAEAIGSEAEAQAFATRVQQMIAQHMIDQSELEREEEQLINEIVSESPGWKQVRVRRKRVPWLNTLATCVADGNFCSLLISPKSSQVWFVGRKSNVELAIEVYTRLVDLAESIADKEYVKFFYECRDNGDQTAARGFRQSFLEGFARRMKMKYWEELKNIEDIAAKKVGAMVLFKSEREKIRDYIDDMLGWKEKSVIKLSNLTEFEKKTPGQSLLWSKGYNWAIVMGKKSPRKLLGLFPSEDEANKALWDMDDTKPMSSGKDYNAEGQKRGKASADKIDISSRASQEDKRLA